MLARGCGCDEIETGEVDDEGLGTAANDHPGDGFGGGVNFLVWKVGGNEDKVTRAHGFGTFAVAAPADLSTAFEHVNDGFLLAVVVHGTSGMRLGNHYAATDMGGTGKIAVDGGEAQNAGGLRCVAVELIVAGNMNVGHHRPPKFRCEGTKGRCTWQGQCQPSHERPFVKVFCKSVRWNQRKVEFFSTLQNYCGGNAGHAPMSAIWMRVKELTQIYWVVRPYVHFAWATLR
jgi:hypothetical protein